MEDGDNHGLRTPNEGINQRNLKIGADVADKIINMLRPYLKIWVLEFIFCEIEQDWSLGQ